MTSVVKEKAFIDIKVGGSIDKGLQSSYFNGPPAVVIMEFPGTTAALGHFIVQLGKCRSEYESFL